MIVDIAEHLDPRSLMRLASCCRHVRSAVLEYKQPFDRRTAHQLVIQGPQATAAPPAPAPPPPSLRWMLRLNITWVLHFDRAGHPPCNLSFFATAPAVILVKPPDVASSGLAHVPWLGYKLVDHAQPTCSSACSRQRPPACASSRSSSAPISNVFRLCRSWRGSTSATARSCRRL